MSNLVVTVCLGTAAAYLLLAVSYLYHSAAWARDPMVALPVWAICLALAAAIVSSFPPPRGPKS
jgi:hypothetical protein